MATVGSQVPPVLTETLFSDQAAKSGVSWPWLRWFVALVTLLNSRFLPVPSSATAQGTVGQMAFDGNFLYVCYAPNAWKKVALVNL